MKNWIVLPLVLSLIACGENGASVEDKETEEVSENPGSNLSEDTEEIDSTVEVREPVDTENWQINDYAEFLLNRKIAANAEELEEHLDLIFYYSTLDLKGGYAYVTGWFEGWHEFVLWRMKNGNDLVGFLSAGCGPVCEYDFKFYEFENGEKTDVTKVVIPFDQMDGHAKDMHRKFIEKNGEPEYPDDWFYKFKFPQKGTSMMVDLIIGAEEGEMPLFKLGWDKEKFFIEEKYDKIPELY